MTTEEKLMQMRAEIQRIDGNYNILEERIDTYAKALQGQLDAIKERMKAAEGCVTRQAYRQIDQSTFGL